MTSVPTNDDDTFGQELYKYYLWNSANYEAMALHLNQTDCYKLLSICFTSDSIMFDVGNCVTDDIQDTASLSLDEVKDALDSTSEGRTTDNQILAFSWTLSQTTLPLRFARFFLKSYFPYNPLSDIPARTDMSHVNKINFNRE